MIPAQIDVDEQPAVAGAEVVALTPRPVQDVRTAEDLVPPTWLRNRDHADVFLTIAAGAAS